MKCPVLVVILVLTTLLRLRANRNARISGRVTDLSGAVIVGAECKITNLEPSLTPLVEWI